eukprot:10040189-Lingulodinium_polyedra.AAC.1
MLSCGSVAAAAGSAAAASSSSKRFTSRWTSSSCCHWRLRLGRAGKRCQPRQPPPPCPRRANASSPQGHGA